MLYNDSEQITRTISWTCWTKSSKFSIYTWTALCWDIKSDCFTEYQGNMGRNPITKNIVYPEVIIDQAPNGNM